MSGEIVEIKDILQELSDKFEEITNETIKQDDLENRKRLYSI